MRALEFSGAIRANFFQPLCSFFLWCIFSDKPHSKSSNALAFNRCSARMRFPRSARRPWLVVAGVCALLGDIAQSAESTVDRSFFAEHPILQFVEKRLPVAATVALPPRDSGKHVATDLELRAAFAAVLDDFLAPPSTFAARCGELIG